MFPLYSQYQKTNATIVVKKLNIPRIHNLLASNLTKNYPTKKKKNVQIKDK